MKPVANLALALAAGALIATAAGAQKAYIDYDKSVNLSAYKTFTMVEPKGEDGLAQRAPLAHQHLIDGIKSRIAAGGKLTESASNPDLYITYRVTSKEEMNVSTTGYGYGMGPGWGGGYYYGGGGWGAATTTVNTYTVGTLIIDVWDAKTKKAVWRGIASSTVPDNPQKGIKKIDSALDKLVKKWKDMRGE